MIQRFFSTDDDVQTLRRRVAELEALLRIVPMGLAIATDSEAANIKSNPYLADILGVPSDANISLTALVDQLPAFRLRKDGEDIPPKELPLQRVAASGVPLKDVDLEVVRPDGQIRHIKGNVEPLLDDDGAPMGCVGAFWDVTEVVRMEAERQKAEERLRASEERYRRLVETSADAIFLADTRGQLLVANEQCARLFRYERPEDMAGVDYMDLVAPEDRERAQGISEELFVTGSVRVEIAMWSVDGVRIPCEASASLIRDIGGETEGYVCVIRDISDRREAEERQRASERRHQALLQHSYDAIIVVDAGGSITYASPSTLRVFGYTPQELVGRSAFEVIYPDDIPIAQAKLGEVLGAPGNRVGIELRIQHKNGTLLWIEVTGHNLLDEPQVRGILSNFRDITERKQAEEALHTETKAVEALHQVGMTLSAELDLQKLVQAVTDAGTQLTRAGFGAFFYNVLDDAGERYMLYTLSGAPREAFSHLPMPRNTAIFKATFGGEGVVRLDDVTLDPRYSQNAPYHGVPPGHLPVRSYLAAPVVSRSGEVLGGLFFGHPEPGMFTERDERMVVGLASHAAIALDNARLYQAAQAEIARRQHVEETLEAHAHQTTLERNRLQSLVDICPVGLMVCETDGSQSILVNRETERLFGFPHDPLRGIEQYREAAAFEKLDGTALEPTPVERALTKGESTLAQEAVIKGRNGGRLPVLLSAIPLLASSGDVIGAIGVLQDLTPLKDAERLRNEFQAMVSHELRSPLAVIKSILHVARDEMETGNTSEWEELLNSIDGQTDRLLSMVNNLLDISQMEAGTFTVVPEHAELQPAIDDALATMRRISPALVDLQVPARLPLLKIDKSRTAQVIVNLLSNAVKFAREGTPIVLQADQTGEGVTVRVRNQGPPIPENYLPYLFMKFSQIGSEQSRKAQGTGLGLAICKGIVEAHGGRIWAESSEERQETVFSFTLPAAESDAATTPTGPAQDEGEAAGRRRRVLAVDDEPQILRHLTRFLNRAGYEAITTEDPVGVAELVRRERPDLILLDLRLPGMSGFDVLEEVRQFSGVPVIFLSANDRAEDKAQALRMGAQDYVTKPFSHLELEARMEAAFRHRAAESGRHSG